MDKHIIVTQEDYLDKLFEFALDGSPCIAREFSDLPQASSTAAQLTLHPLLALRLLRAPSDTAQEIRRVRKRIVRIPTSRTERLVLVIAEGIVDRFLALGSGHASSSGLRSTGSPSLVLGV